MKPTWLWPLSWYCRIKDLEWQVDVLKAENRKLDAQMRAEAIAHTIALNTHMQTMMATITDYEQQIGEYEEARRRRAAREMYETSLMRARS
jgi:glutamate-1-semialdehyde aminotransferase